MRFLASLILVCFSTPIFPCKISSPEKPLRNIPSNHAALVNGSDTILLVEAVVPANSVISLCQFRIVDTLKGNLKFKIPLTCKLTHPQSPLHSTHLSGHTDSKFWEYGEGRPLARASDCRYRPGFEVGHYYLLFFGKLLNYRFTNDAKRFEEISGPSDKWLIFVKKQISKEKK